MSLGLVPGTPSGTDSLRRAKSSVQNCGSVPSSARKFIGREDRRTVACPVTFPDQFTAIEFPVVGPEGVVVGESEVILRPPDRFANSRSILQSHGDDRRKSADFCRPGEEFRQCRKPDPAVRRGFEYRIRSVFHHGDSHVREIQPSVFTRRRGDRSGHIRTFSGLKEQVARLQCMVVPAA